MDVFGCRDVFRSPLAVAVLAALFLPARAFSQTPTVTRVLPAFGAIGGSNIVIVGGTNFQAGATVTFGGTPASSVIVNNATTLTAKPPAHSAGPVTVAVTNPNAQSGNLSNAYKYLAPAGTFGFQFFPTPVDVYATDITAGPDGNLWLLTNGGETLNPDGVAKVTTSGTVTPYPLADPGLLIDIAPGMDGNLWYIRERAPFTMDPAKVARITPLGVATEFTLAVGAQPRGITAGPDGAMWFTEFDASLVDRITTAGAITTYPIVAHPHGITLGPDGQLWLAGCPASGGGSGVCGRFSTNGQLMSFPVPNPASESGVCPRRIVAGPDGNLWFQFSGRMVIGRMSPAGVYQEFPVSAGMDIRDIAAGIDGNLWFTVVDFGGIDSWIGRVTPAGGAIEFPLPQFSSPRGITSGPDGALWFSDGYDVGRINPGGPPQTSATSFYTVTPCRALDTRNADGLLGGPSITAGVTRGFVIAGQCGVPPSARAISANLVVTQAAAAGYLTVYPGGTSTPLASSLNYRAGQTRANNAVVPLGVAGDIAVVSGQPSGTVHFILDINGYFQ